jgi:hypothetical protein
MKAAILAIVASVLPAHAAREVAIVVEGDPGAPALYGVGRLERSLKARGLAVTRSRPGAPVRGDYIVVARLDGGGPETLAVRRSTYQGKPALTLTGGDARGLMYAALDTAERVAGNAPGDDPFARVRDAAEQPYLAGRGISMYTMQRAYFESRLYDEKYWERYFDLLAASRINNFIVIFGYENGGFMAPLYPYFFNVPEYSGVELVGITPAQQVRNTAAFKAMMRIAHERGIDITAGIWDHIYRGGVQGGGIPGAAANAGKRVPGLVWGVTAENLSGYTKAALRRFLEVFPEVDAIQFRMHDESGLKHEEMAGFWHEVFVLIKTANPKLRVDLRVKDLPDAVINDALDQGLNTRVNTKYWMEQMGLPFHPTHVNVQNQHDRRHGYADLLHYPQRYRVQWQLWSGGTARVLLWGDPDYVRRFAASARLYDGNSFEVNEMLATKMLGEPHDEQPLPILNSRYRYYDYEFERYWDFYRLWGRLTYNPQASPDVWEREFDERFGAAGVHVRKALEAASKVLPRIVAAAYRYQYFPTTRGWAEMNHQDSLPKFATAENSDIQQFESPRDEARRILRGDDTAMRRPQDTARRFAELSNEALSQIGLAEKAIGSRAGNEFVSTATDVKILAGLARYYAARLPAAVAYNLYKESGEPADFDEAIAGERKAVQAWREIVAAAGDVYSENLAFGAHAVGFRRHWKEELGLLQQDFDALLSERAKVTEKAASKPPFDLTNAEKTPPDVQLQPSTAEPGRDLPVSAKVTAPAGVKWMRLRYRHVSQYEDYLTADMTADAKTGLYTASIPASFIDPKWDVMYFVEVVGKDGAGRMYPDLEQQAPYMIVRVKR